MAWIKSHQELRNHPKVARLASLLNISKPSVIGHLHLLWWWSMDYAPDGNLSNFSLEEIQDAMLFEKKVVARINILDTLVKSGFVDENLIIHDWYEYAGDLLEKKAKHAQKMREYRSQQKPINNHVPITCQSRDEIDKKDKKDKIDYIIENHNNNELDLSDNTLTFEFDRMTCNSKYPLISMFYDAIRKYNSKYPIVTSNTGNSVGMLALACEENLKLVKELSKSDFQSIMEIQMSFGNNPVNFAQSPTPVKVLNAIAINQIAYLKKQVQSKPFDPPVKMWDGKTSIEIREGIGRG